MKLSIKKVLSTILLSTILLLFNFALTNATEKNEIDFEKIDTYVKTSIKNGHIPGLSLGVVQGDKVIYLKSYGIAGPKNKVLTPQTAFHTGSIGKTFTALAIRQLANENKLDYNAPVKKYIPWFHTANISEGSKITINNLINHESGFSKLQGNADYLYDGRYSTEDLVKKINNVKPAYPIGRDEYSNINFIILGLVIEKISGESYNNYVTKHIFKPLNMNNSFFSDAEASKHSFAMGHKVSFGFIVPYMYKNYPKGSVPAGFEICSSEDMTHLLIAYLNNGYYNGVSIIPNNSLLKPSANNFIYKDGYYNIYWGTNNDFTNFGHVGADNYFHTSMLINPNSEFGIIVLTNSRNEDLYPEINAANIANGIMSLVSYGNTVALSTKSNSKTYYMYNALFALIGLFLLTQFIRLRNYGRRVKNSKFSSLVHFIILFIINILFPIAILICEINIANIDFSKIIYRTQLYGIDYYSILLVYLVIFSVLAIIKTSIFYFAVKNKKARDLKM